MKTISLNNSPITPSKIICIGRNYSAHALELGNAIPSEPVVFLKPNSAISQYLYSSSEEANHYEAELSFLVSAGRIVAVGFGLDLTRRETQNRLKEAKLPWERAKAFDGAAVFSEFVEINEEDIDHLSFTLSIDGQQVQHGLIDLMMFKPLTTVNAIKQFMTLEDGDIIMTGTPEGVGPVVKGATFSGHVYLNEQSIIEASWVAKDGNPEC